jgi:hypothetical protein
VNYSKSSSNDQCDLRYKMPLLIISDQTIMHTNFYVAFCFMSQETSADYTWILNQLKMIYVKTTISFPTVIVTDMKKKLMSTIRIVFSPSIIINILCLWHINKNVLANCKKSFAIKKEWEKFFTQWQTVVYASSKTVFWDEWDKLLNQYNQSHEDCMTYLTFIYIGHRRLFARCYTNKILHFEITTTSRDEDAHAVLKKQLRSSSNDLKIVINDINLLLINEYTNYLTKINIDKTRFSMKLNKPIFQNLAAFVIIYALRKIMTQYQLLTDQPTMLQPCTKIFTNITGLSCSHVIQKRLFNDEKLLLKDVHPHWR